MRTVRTGAAKAGPVQLPGKKLAGLIIAGLLLYICAVGLAGLRMSFHAAAAARPEAVLLALFWVGVSYICAAASYCLLAVKPIRFLPALLIQAAGGLVNRLLPGGLGGLGINALYLRRAGHKLAVATAIVAVNNLMGFIGNMLLLVLVSLYMPFTAGYVGRGSLPHIPVAASAGMAIAVLLLAYAAYRRRLLGRAKNWFMDMLHYIRLCARRPLRSVLALGTQMALTSCHATAVYFAAAAFLPGAVSWPIALLAVSAGSIAGAAVPTPGGIGGAEAGIAAILVAFHIPTSVAVATALTYRLLTYWLPLLPGYLALRIAERRYL